MQLRANEECIDLRLVLAHLACDLRFAADLDRLNFAEVAAGTPIATLSGGFDEPLVVANEAGNR